MRMLEQFGPGTATPAPSEADALAYVAGLATSHYENFSVLSSLVPADLRADFAAVYAFCRWSDDLGDETGSDEAARSRSLALLGWWREQTLACFQGTASHPVLIALATTVRKHTLPAEPFLDLISAFEQDQTVREYANWPELLDYCRRSANPVGRIVLHLGGYPNTDANAERYRLSDATCTALQLINFWQDVRRDLLERDRVYIPRHETGITPTILKDWLARPNDPAARTPYILAMRPLVDRTLLLFDLGAPLPAMLEARIGPVVWLFGAGGRAVLQAVQSTGCATLWSRPRLSKLKKVSLVAQAWLKARLGRRSASPKGVAA